VGRPLWREDGSLFCICSWPAQSFSGPNPLGLETYFTVSDLRLLFSSPPTTRKVTVEVFDPASTRLPINLLFLLLITSQHGPRRNTPFPLLWSNCCVIRSLLPSNGNVFTEPLPRNWCGINSPILRSLHSNGPRRHSRKYMPRSRRGKRRNFF
jgi:hypothetical protein